MMKQMLSNSYLFGTNTPYVEELYEKYLDNPGSIDPTWRDYFDKLSNLPGAGAYLGPDVPHAPVIASFAQRAKEGALRVAQRSSGASHADKQTKVLQLINAYRFLGNRWAQLDPLKRHTRPEVAELEPSFYGFTEADLSTTFRTGSFDIGIEEATLREILEALRLRYCGHIGAEYMYIADVQQKRWIQARYEPMRVQSRYNNEDKKRLLSTLTAAETLERYLHTRYVGQKRFSLEGGESMMVAMDQLIRTAGGHGVKEIVIGMAHRGRLNVLVNTLGKQPAMLFDEFEGKKKSDLIAGDVKYHMGYSSDVATPGGPVHLTLAFNPSHLEIVNPVVAGSVFARQSRRGENGKGEVISVLIHGDAAVAGQGVNQEMLNFSQTRGYGTGGTVHIVINNQIGFTTSDPRDLRSSLYCTDIFKMVEAPIFHVNGDDPEAVAFVTEMAMDFRKEFKKDVVIDIICFRKLGHNEADEPMVTQPLMYKKVAAHPGTRKQYAERLSSQGVLVAGEDEQMIKDYRAALDAGKHLHDPVITDYKSQTTIDWSAHTGAKYTELCDTTVPVKELQRLGERLTHVPTGFTLHPRVQKIMDDRRLMVEGKLPIDWGMAENLAYATLLAAGYGVRLSGEDVGRGTFFHRHAVFHDQNREKWDEGTWVPLHHLQDTQGKFQCFDSVLSEEAVMAFEYGYATASPNDLVVWEGQFGDFANGAQVVIDQFLASGEAKWGRGCGLVLLLPHGLEGQGPEHSSGRIERFLQLSADFNWEVCMPTSAGQMFHLLRRQMLRKQRKPLVVFTPKSLLRSKENTSSLEDLSDGTFQTVFGDVDDLDAKKVTRVICCAGKVYYDLRTARRERKLDHIAIVRIPQLYPMDDRRLAEELQRYPGMKELVWCQEEPENQGAWYAKHHRLMHMVKKGQSLHVVARPASASPAVGSAAKHAEQLKVLVETAFGPLK
ncbi:MAG: 2-oxoglutarate dehydrogenase E1 component [Rhodocyclaceae bacterium]|nr:2-oxoglutarate dehydrogenase E1 component [Rhodocyclaceae bacterium]MDZ4213775.1 2-oxoglutarate dehydrogenase E1 component [Rhodocyclaceae bacterium]